MSLTSVSRQETLAKASQIAKALGDETRLRILAMLADQELCACQIIDVFELANSTISKHLSVLKQAGLLQSRKSGRWIYYTWASVKTSRADSELIHRTQHWLRQILASDPQIARDRHTVTQILKTDPEVLCRRQNGKDCCPD